jgi:transposase
MKKYRVRLSPEERDRLTALTSAGTLPTREVKRAMILLKADESAGGPAWSDAALSQALDVHVMTVVGVRQRYTERGLTGALKRAPTGHRAAVLDGAGEAHLIALTCSEPPAGQTHWTLRLLAERLVELAYVDAISHETVRQVLKKTHSSRG